MAAIFENYRARVAAIPPLAAFSERADALIRPDDPDTLWALEPALRDLLASDFVSAFLHHELTTIAGNHFYYLPGSSDLHAPLVESAGYSLVIRLLSPEVLAGAPLVTLTEHVMLAAWRDPVDVETFAIPPPFRNEVFDRSKRLEPRGTITLTPGTVARFRAPAETFRLHLQAPTVLIHLVSGTAASLRWLFHPETLEPVRASATSLAASRLQFTCQTLAALGSPTSVAPLKKLTAHPEHYVRWAAIQSICRLSRDEGIACLERALDDDHPHVRNAAQKTLATI